MVVTSLLSTYNSYTYIVVQSFKKKCPTQEHPKKRTFQRHVRSSTKTMHVSEKNETVENAFETDVILHVSPPTNPLTSILDPDTRQVRTWRQFGQSINGNLGLRTNRDWLRNRFISFPCVSTHASEIPGASLLNFSNHPSTLERYQL